jgi:hypothetical protein
MPHLPDNQHPDHDLELVAAYAAGDATGPELERVTALVSTCAECAALHHDLRAIAAAMPELPAPARPRDFRLTTEQAASLRPSGIRGLLATLSGPKFSFATPLGTGLAALGIVGVLVASGGLPTGGGTAAPQPETEAAAQLAAPASDAPAEGMYAAGAQPADASPAASAAPAEIAPAPSEVALKAAPAPTAAPSAGAADTGAYAGATDTSADSGAAAATGSEALLGLAALLVFVGAALVAARLVARRLARAP